MKVTIAHDPFDTGSSDSFMLKEMIGVEAFTMRGTVVAIDRMKECGYLHYDQVYLKPEDDLTPYSQWHKHSEDEVRWCTAGSGIFYFQYRDKVVNVQLDDLDAIIIPARTLHAFNRDPAKATQVSSFMRFYRNNEGWTPIYPE